MASIGCGDGAADEGNGEPEQSMMVTAGPEASETASTSIPTTVGSTNDTSTLGNAESDSVEAHSMTNPESDLAPMDETVSNQPQSGQTDGEAMSNDPSSTSENMATTPEMTPTNPEDNAGCDLAGPAAVKIRAQVSWPATIGMEAGSGMVEVWFVADISDDGTNVTASGHVCEVAVPDFQTKVFAGGDTHGTVIPQEAWAAGPKADLVVELGDRQPGEALRIAPTPMLLGADIPDPMGDWPSTHAEVSSVDHDGDGYPGVTSFAAMGPGYSNPRIGALNPNLRANRIFLGLRNIIGLDGMLTSCETAEGNASLTLDQRAFGCLTPDGQECNRSQTSLLDNNMPQFEVGTADFVLKRLEAGADCDAVRASLP